MLVMTARFDMKKIAVILAAAVALIVGLILLLGGKDDTEVSPTAAGAVTTNDDRVKFLTDFGWEVAASPAETSQVRIPEESSQVFERYNALQKSQGFDLTAYAGKTVMRYVYKIQNYPGATEPVYATLLVYKNQVIGGDVTDTAARGQIRGFQMPKETQMTQPTTTPTTAPTSASSE